MQHSIGAKCRTQKPSMVGGLAGDNNNNGDMTTRDRAVYAIKWLLYDLGLDLRPTHPDRNVEASGAIPGAAVV